MTHERIMNLGITYAQKTMMENIGGPFGAVITKESDDGQNDVIAVSSNHVIANNDPTAHAEVMAIREACKKLGTYDLSGYTLYATSEPCPMCLAAIIWANIKTVYYGCTAKDAADIGFRDDYIYKYIEDGCSDDNVLKMIPSSRNKCIQLFDTYAAMNKIIY